MQSTPVTVQDKGPMKKVPVLNIKPMCEIGAAWAHKQDVGWKTFTSKPGQPWTMYQRVGPNENRTQ